MLGLIVVLAVVMSGEATQAEKALKPLGAAAGGKIEFRAPASTPADVGPALATDTLFTQARMEWLSANGKLSSPQLVALLRTSAPETSVSVKPNGGAIITPGAIIVRLHPGGKLELCRGGDERGWLCEAEDLDGSSKRVHAGAATFATASAAALRKLQG